MQADLSIDCRNQHGEGVLWNPDDGCVWWTDIHGQAMWWHNPEKGTSGSYPLSRRLCAFAPRRNGGWIMAFEDAVELWTKARVQESVLHRFEPDNTETRLNDGHLDRFGNFVVGGMNETTGKADSTVIRVRADLEIEILIKGVSCANSTCFSPDGKTMYFADTTDRFIRAYPYSNFGLGAPIIHVDMRNEPGLPDGSCVDAEGGIWNAQWEGSQVVRFDKNGHLTHRITLPVSRVTCCTFGGPNLATLYITTSRLMASPDELERAPLSGSLFEVRPGFVGITEIPFDT